MENSGSCWVFCLLEYTESGFFACAVGCLVVSLSAGSSLVGSLVIVSGSVVLGWFLGSGSGSSAGFGVGVVLFKSEDVSEILELKFFLLPLPLNFRFEVEWLAFKEGYIHRMIKFVGGWRIALVSLVLS